MPKAEKGSVKDIANKIKAKGLQKLKFYCQMCEKQCRDANGFKCHLTSESHLRQMKLFSDNAGGILDKFSKEFEQSYLTTLRMRHGTKQVNANNIYQELISDKQHIHMNATHWTTLSEFVQYLGKSGKCVVEENERGWFVSYIERDASILARKEAQQRREAADRAAEEAQAQRMELQRVEAAKALDRVGGALNLEATSLERPEDDKPIKVALGSTISSSSGVAKAATKKKATPAAGFEEDDDDDGENDNDSMQDRLLKEALEQKANNKIKMESTLPKSKLKEKDEIVNKNKRNKDDGRDDDGGSKKKRKSDSGQDRYRKDYWLYKNIVVRVISKKLADGKYFRRKAVVDRLVDKYTAEVEVMDSGPDTNDGGDVLRLDQDDLETVIPKKDDRNQKVRILNGKYRGCKAKINYVDKKAYKADLQVLEEDGKLIRDVPFEDFSSIA
jgi:DNA/RNA-binding protein KIN17